MAESNVNNDSKESPGVSEEGNMIVPPLLPPPTTLSKPDDKLCDVCRKLDLSPKRFIISPSENIRGIVTKDPDIHLGRAKDIKKKKNCALCRLGLTLLGGKSLPTVQDQKSVQVGMGWLTQGPTPGAYPVQSYTPVARVLQILAYTGKGKNRASVVGSGPVFPRLTLLANDAPEESPKLRLMRIIDKEKIDFNIVRNALKLCEKWHGNLCDRSKTFHAYLEDPAAEIPHFRLIDVENDCIILPPKGCSYATLSYVWGKIEPLKLLKANAAQLAETGSLLRAENRDRIPLTIRDAMEVVRRINLRYLWVDSLCIIQDDDGPGGSKMSAISKMDLVYGGSYIVIMAATGMDANAGLPGVWPGTRGSGAEQIIEEIGARRAWTFQEQELASRSLVFQNGRVVFRCQKVNSEWNEDVVFEDTMEAVQQESPKDEDSKETRIARFNINDFSDMIMSYSGMQLTQETDIYHAFAGMNRHFEAGLEASLCHGIPNTLFDWFLLWLPRQPIARRALAPSWSWAGWRGKAVIEIIGQVFSHDPLKNRMEIRRKTWIMWYQRKAHDSTDCKLIWIPPQEPGQSSEPRNFYGRVVKPRFTFDCTQTLPTPRTIVGAPNYLEDSHNPLPGSGFLQFWTVSVAFELKTSENLDYERSRSRSNLVRVGIFGRSQRELGCVLVNPEWAEKSVLTTHEFILLCEGRGGFYNSGKVSWKYVMMLLEWHGDWAERVALGAIEKEDLSGALEQGPVWKEIILG
ncbi:hypothetical protein CVT26_001898 [Gymnopilus dilepis]|uniref:Heterokaryon incompatibility domain-containing protein n=1 Tax=Gymnopilus dilepis TaxID=231916 RepID=A0A409Y3Z8_9AGAR|nr:hypothetical protein CVT26_001898 [Gymnopilus dilepis]